MTCEQYYRIKLPKLAAKMDLLQIPLTPIINPWFASLLTTCLPTSALLPAWDCLLYDGPKFLHRAALALLQRSESAILQARDPTHLKTLLQGKIRMYL